MSRKNDRWVRPLPGPCPNLGPQMTVMISDDDKAGVPLPPPVELTPRSPPLEITEMYPNPLPPPPPPFDRAAALAGVQAAFALLGDDEFRVARLRMLGVRFVDIGDELELSDDEVVKLWKQARKKLGNAIFGAA